MRSAGLLFAYGILLLGNSGFSLAIDSGKAVEANIDPTPLGGGTSPVYRIPGARSSANLATVVHCTNLESTAVTVYVGYYEYTGTLQCTTLTPIAASGTRSFATRSAAAFSLDSVCPSPPTIGQGQALISVSPVGSRIICSAQIVSVTGDPPMAITALDVYRAN